VMWLGARYHRRSLCLERRENSRCTGENTKRKQHEASLIGLLRHQIERTFKCKVSQPVALMKLRQRDNTVARHVGCEPLDLLPSALAIKLLQITSNRADAVAKVEVRRPAESA
jgi:hypothetical protein